MKEYNSKYQYTQFYFLKYIVITNSHTTLIILGFIYWTKFKSLYKKLAFNFTSHKNVTLVICSIF